MYNNAALIDELDSWKNAILSDLLDYKVNVYSFNDIGIAGKVLTLREIPLTQTAMNKVLNVLRVKRNFMDLSHEEPIDWQEIFDRIVALCGDGSIYAKQVVKKTGELYITDVYFRPSDNNQVPLNPVDYFLPITDALATTERNFVMGNKYFDSVSGTIVFSIIDTNIGYDLGNGENDMWERGLQFAFDFLSFKISPYVYRKEYNNGFPVRQKSKRKGILTKKYNLDFIGSIINETIMEDEHMEIDSLVAIAANKCANVNISLSEFHEIRDAFILLNDTESYNDIINENFYDTDFNAMYDVDVLEKSKKWLSTADTGINAYNFLNKMIKITSPETILDMYDKMELEQLASSFLFKKNFDMHDIAPILLKSPN